jgi:hypothetical protein
MYIISGKREYKIQKRFNLRNIDQITLASKNFTLALFSFSTGNDLLLDSYRRVDIILYMIQRMRKAKYEEIFKIIYLKNFKLTKPDLNYEIEINYKNKKKNKMPILQETFRNVQKSGYLKIKKRKLLKKNFQEYFFMLCNIGLVYFKNFGTGRSSGFIPFLGADVKPGRFDEYKKTSIFVIEYKGGAKVVLMALSDVERDEWIKGIVDYQREALNSRDNYELMKGKIKRMRKK